MVQQVKMAPGRLCNASSETHISFANAVSNNNVELVIKLLESGKCNANMELTIDGGLTVTALYYSVMYGYANMVDVLCTHGACVDQKVENGGWGPTPLILSEGCANVNTRRTGHTVLMMACTAGCHLVLQELLKFSPDLNARNFIGHTALHMASMPHIIRISTWDSPTILGVLLEQNNLEYGVKNNKGQTPVDLLYTGPADLWPEEFCNISKVAKMFVLAGFSVNQDLLGKLLALMEVFMQGIACDLYGQYLQTQLEEVKNELCTAIEIYLAAGCCVGKGEHRAMTSAYISPVLKISGIHDYAFGPCSNSSPASLKRLCKLHVRHNMRKPIGQFVQKLGLPNLLSSYIVLDRIDLD